MTGRLLHYAGPVLRAARERAGATQREVAQRAGSSTATVSRFENGIALPSDQLVDAVIDACREGPPSARVDRVDQREATPGELGLRGPEEFAVLATAL